VKLATLVIKKTALVATHPVRSKSLGVDFVTKAFGMPLSLALFFIFVFSLLTSVIN